MLLEVKNLDVSYGSRLTVSGVSFELDKGEIMSVVGESGSGKTTVIRAVMGCLPGRGHVTGGSVLFDGRDLLKITPQEHRQLCGRDISMIFQDSGSMINPIRRIGTQFVDYIRTHAPPHPCAAKKQGRSRTNGTGNAEAHAPAEPGKRNAKLPV